MRLIGLCVIDVNGNALPLAEYAYDGNGKRVRVSRPQAGVAHRYVSGATGNQGLESALLVTDDVGGVTGDYVFAGEHALWRHGGGTGLGTNIYLRDAVGSVIGTVDETGTVIDSFGYDAFGNVRGGSIGLPEGTHGGDSRFQGMFKDAGSEFYFVRARYYDSRTGRFLSRDPAEGALETPESFYAYAFANGNPWVFRDPSGRFSLQEFAIGLYVRAQLSVAAIGSAGIAAAGRIAERLRPLTSRLPNLGDAFQTLRNALPGSTSTVNRASQILNQLSSKDRLVVERATELFSKSPSPRFLDQLGHLAQATAEIIPGGKVNPIGTYLGNQIYGSLVSRIGIVQVQGVTYMVRARLDQTVEVLGKLF